MAQDIQLIEIDNIYDLNITDDGTDFSEVDGFETAIIISLFTDARGTINNTVEAFRRRGWVGNVLTLLEDYELGSVLWTLEQARMNQATLNSAERITLKALNWMLKDGIADNIKVSATQIDSRNGKLEIVLYKKLNEVAKYTTTWLNTKGF